MRNVQPLFADFEFGGLAICHNGNLTNSYQLRRQLVRRGSLFQSTSDTEVIVHLIATSLKDTVVDRLTDGLRQVEGAYSLVALSQDSVIGLRDSNVAASKAKQPRLRRRPNISAPLSASYCAGLTRVSKADVLEIIAEAPLGCPARGCSRPGMKGGGSDGARRFFFDFSFGETKFVLGCLLRSSGLFDRGRVAGLSSPVWSKLLNRGVSAGSRSERIRRQNRVAGKWRRNGLKRLNPRREMVWSRKPRSHKIWYTGRAADRALRLRAARTRK